MLYFIADTHFGDQKIIAYCNRPFSSLEDMTEKIISKWNNKVKENDIVFMLGDLSFYDLELISFFRHIIVLRGDKNG